MPFDPASIALYLGLFGKATEIVAGLRAQLKASGVTDAELDRIDADYAQRIAAREAEAHPNGE